VQAKKDTHKILVSQSRPLEYSYFSYNADPWGCQILLTIALLLQVFINSIAKIHELPPWKIAYNPHTSFRPRLCWTKKVQGRPMRSNDMQILGWVNDPVGRPSPFPSWHNLHRKPCLSLTDRRCIAIAAHPLRGMGLAHISLPLVFSFRFSIFCWFLHFFSVFCCFSAFILCFPFFPLFPFYIFLCFFFMFKDNCRKFEILKIVQNEECSKWKMSIFLI
jgi:hypothetical protein